MTIHKEGYQTLGWLFFALAVINSYVFWFFEDMYSIALGVSIALYVFVLSFFRKPERKVTLPSDDIILAPADGKVVVIEKVYETEVLQKECMLISVFMSPLNVHINWYPVNGEVSYYKYHPGKYLVAWNPKSSTENERTTVVLDTRGGKILLRQIAGALARRIVCYAASNSKVSQGDEMGFIKFGSRVDIYLPLNADIKVSLNQKVEGNKTAIAELVG